MPKVGRKLKAGSLRGGANKPFKGKKGTGTRFKHCKDRMRAKGARDPAAMCAAIGRAKYGKGGMAKMAAKGK